MLNIRAAKRAEYEAVKDFYDSLIDSMENSPFHPGWEKGIYPAYDYLLDSIKKGQLVLRLAGGANRFLYDCQSRI